MPRKNTAKKLETKNFPEALETKGGTDLDRMEALIERLDVLGMETKGVDLDQLETRVADMESKQQQRPPESGRASLDDDYEWGGGDEFDLGYKSANIDYWRTGDESAFRDLAMETKDFSTLRQEDGGYWVHEEFSDSIEHLLFENSPIRQIARIMTISSKSVELPASVSGPDAGWVGEEDARPTGKTPKLDMMEIMPGEMFSRLRVTQTILEDSAIDIEGYLAELIADKFARQEAESFITGDGVKKPRGFLVYPQVADASWAWGKLGFVKSGVAADLPDTNPGDMLDPLVDIQTALKPEYHSGARWVMNQRTSGRLRKLKDADGKPLWSESVQEGEPSRLLGYPVTIAEHMPDIAANQVPIAFGNFMKGYTIVDRIGRSMRRLDHEPPHVQFYARQRVGGDVTNSQAIKLLKIAE
ncbi:MAG: phage major capsid protein [Pseudomonadota bacterium]